ncbi:MAG: GTP pyrophosphokinase family protein [Oscillospiraceae bacterium]|nr:GTP pyrophosphokinase family protein [Oscillospiraceae bacterium]
MTDRESLSALLDRMNDPDMTEAQFIQSVESDMLPIQQFFSYYRCAIMEIETKFRVLDEQFSLRGENDPIEFIQSRIKSYGSIMHKVSKLGIPHDLASIEEHLYDIAGIRVVCSFRADIYKLADCFLRQDDITLLERKDYIANPKPNGYRSLHLIVEVPIFPENEKRPVKAEVQLRTLAMDFWASLEHKLRYKKDLPPETLAALADDLKACAEESAAWDEKMQSIRSMLQ